MERELMTREELKERCEQLEEANLDLQTRMTNLNNYTNELLHTATKAILLYKAEHGFIDYRAALAEIMQKCKERGIE